MKLTAKTVFEFTVALIIVILIIGLISLPNILGPGNTYDMIRPIMP